MTKPVHEKSTSLTIREMQVKTTVSISLVSVECAIFKKSGNTKCWQDGKGNPLNMKECKLVHLPWKIVQRFLKKLKRRSKIPYCLR